MAMCAHIVISMTMTAVAKMGLSASQVERHPPTHPVTGRQAGLAFPLSTPQTVRLSGINECGQALTGMQLPTTTSHQVICAAHIQCSEQRRAGQGASFFLLSHNLCPTLPPCPLKPTVPLHLLYLFAIVWFL